MYKERIEKYFEEHKNEMLNHISELIKINSIKGDAKEGMPFGEGPAKALEEALKIAESFGFKTKNYDNYVGTVDFNDKEKQLDILAHLDVVPVSDDWTVTEPFTPLIKDGKIYGRGTADDKGPAITALYAMKAIKDLNIPLSKNVRLILGTDEECGSSDIAHYYKIEKEAPMTFSPDAEFPLINIEKGRLASEFKAEFKDENELPRIVSFDSGVKANVVPDKANAVIEGFKLDEVKDFAEKYTKITGVKFDVKENGNTVVIDAKGVGAHASTPENGKNALSAMLEMLANMPFADTDAFRKFKGVNELFPYGDFCGKNAGVYMKDDISGEISMSLNILNVTATTLSGTFDSRAPICATDENLRDVLKANMNKYGIVLANDPMIPAHHVDADSDFIKTLLSCYEKYTGNKGECLAIGGGTYVHELKNGVAFGCTMPGTDNNMHGNDEFAVIDELLASAKIFTDAIIELCK